MGPLCLRSARPMKISLDDVKRIARLAHLQFSDPELERLRGHLDQILGYIDKLNELPTDGVEPAAGGTTGPIAPMREDVLLPTLATDTALSQAPESGRGHFKVPRVIG